MYVNGIVSGTENEFSYTTLFDDLEHNYMFFIGCFNTYETLTSFVGNIWSLEISETVWDDYTRYLKFN